MGCLKAQPSPPESILETVLDGSVNLVFLPPDLMALESAYAAGNVDDKIHADVLTKARESCYKARDVFYACLEKECDKKPTEIASVGLLYPTDCKPSRDEFVKHCRSSWVKHFDRQYCQNRRSQRHLDDKKGYRRGPLSLPQPYTFKPSS